MLFIKLLLFLFIISPSYAKLPELKSKQALNNIRFISSNGKITYFINRKGLLKYSRNYKINEIIKGNDYDDYQISSDKLGGFLAISHIKNPHRSQSTYALHDLYFATLGESKVELIGRGIAPKVHLGGLFYSYYIPHEKIIVVKGIKNKNLKYTIQLSHKHNPYFIPQVEMINQHYVIYTDINTTGHSAALLYIRSDKKIETLYKSQQRSQKLNICVKNKKLYVGEFPYKIYESNSTITAIDYLNYKETKSNNIIYSGSMADIGQLICSQNSNFLYFIKTTLYQPEIDFKSTEVAKLNLQSNSVQLLTNLNDINQIMSLGEMIIGKYKGKYLVIDGKNELTDDAIIKDNK